MNLAKRRLVVLVFVALFLPSVSLAIQPAKTKNFFLAVNLITSVLRASALEFNQHLAYKMSVDGKIALAMGMVLDASRITDDTLSLILGSNAPAGAFATAPWLGYDAKKLWNKISKFIAVSNHKNIKALDSTTKAHVKKSAKQLAEMIKLALPSIEGALVIARSGGAFICGLSSKKSGKMWHKGLKMLSSHVSVAVAAFRMIDLYLSSEEDERVKDIMIWTAVGAIALGGIIEFVSPRYNK